MCRAHSALISTQIRNPALTGWAEMRRAFGPEPQLHSNYSSFATRASS